MSDTERDTLNRLGDQLRPPDDAFHRLVTRRDRRHRTRRVTAAAVALSLTAAGVFGAYQIGRRSSTTPGGESTPLPNVAQIQCGPPGFEVFTRQVRPQADGVHLEVTNTGMKAVMFHVVHSETGGFVERAEPGTNIFRASDLPPDEEYRVRCFPEDSLNPETEPSAPLRVTDQDGVWKDPAVSCPAGHSEQSVVYDAIPGATGEDTPPEEIARRELGDSVQEGDIVEIGGYPEARNPVVRVLRGDRVDAAVYLVSVEGGLLVAHLTWCVEDSMEGEPPAG